MYIHMQPLGFPSTATKSVHVHVRCAIASMASLIIGLSPIRRDGRSTMHDQREI